MTWLPSLKRIPQSALQQLRTTAAEGPPHAVLQLVKDDPRLVNLELDQSGQTLLHVLAANGHTEPVKQLILVFGANPEIKEKANWTCCHACCKHGNTAMLLAVLSAAADKFVGGGPAGKYLTAADCESQKRVAVKKLIRMRNKEGQTCLLVACVHNKTTIVEALLQYGAKPDKDGRDKEGNTALHYAVFNKNLHMVKVLLRYTGTATLVCTKNKAGQTPLDGTKDHPGIRELLLATQYSPLLPPSEEMRSCVTDSSFASSVESKESDSPGTARSSGVGGTIPASHSVQLLSTPETSAVDSQPSPSVSPLQTLQDFVLSPSSRTSLDEALEQLQHPPPPLPEAYLEEVAELRAKLRQHEESARCQEEKMQQLEAQNKELSSKVDKQVLAAYTTRREHEEVVADLTAKLISERAECEKLRSAHSRFMQTHSELAATLVQDKDDLKKLEAQVRAQRDEATAQLKKANAEYGYCRQELLETRHKLSWVESELDIAVKTRNELRMAMHALDHLDLNTDGDTALHLACRSNKPDPVAWLMKAGADALRTNRKGVAAWQDAMKHPAVLKVVLEGAKELKDKMLLVACAIPDEATVKLLLREHGASANIVNEQGDTLLHDACQKGAVGIVKLLLEAGANKDAKNAAGKKPAALAHDNEQTCWAVLELLKPTGG